MIRLSFFSFTQYFRAAVNQEPQIASNGGHLIRSHKKLDRLVIKQEWFIRQLKQNVWNTLFHRLLLATQVWQWDWKKRSFWQFLVVFDWSNQWAKNIWNGLQGHSWFYTSLRPHDPSKGARAREILRRWPHVSHDITLSLLILAKKQSNKKINFHFAKSWQINNNV